MIVCEDRLMLMRQLKQFIYIAKFQSISKAARELFMSQQTLSQSMQNFEKKLGAQLFIRTKQGVKLTDFGRRILPRSELMLQQVEDYEAFIREQAADTGRKSMILVEENFLTPSIPTDLILLASKSSLSIEIATGLTSCLSALKDKTCNVVYCFRPTELYGLTYLPLTKEPGVVMLNRHHPLSEREGLTLDDIIGEDLILPHFTYSSFTTSLVKIYAKRNAYPKCAAETHDLSTLIQMLRENVGILIAPSYLIPSFSGREFKILPLKTEDSIFEYGFLLESYDEAEMNEQFFINSMMEYYNKEY